MDHTNVQVMIKKFMMNSVLTTIIRLMDILPSKLDMENTLKCMASTSAKTGMKMMMFIRIVRLEITTELIWSKAY